jgi:uncharacterized membrane protein
MLTKLILITALQFLITIVFFVWLIIYTKNYFNTSNKKVLKIKRYTTRKEGF